MKKIMTGNVEPMFKCIYLIHLLLTFNAIINKTSCMKVTLFLTILFGTLAAVMKIRYCIAYFSYKNFWLLNLFIISYVISSILNYKYGFLDNVQGLVWLCAQIWILYLVNKDLSIDEIKKEFELLIKIFLVIVSIYNIISLIMFLVHYTKADFSGGVQYILGFIWGRLWGVYDDPNHGSVISVSAILAGIYLFRIYKNRIVKILLTISIVIQGTYIYLSDSRTGIICMAIGCSILFAFWIYTIVSSKKILFTVAAFLGGIVLLIIMEAPVQKIMAAYYNNIDIWSNEVIEEDIVTVGREDLKDDPSNRRFDIWNSGIEIFSENTVFGVGRFNFLNYAQSEMPETYIVNNDLQKFDSMHNMPLDVLASQGLVGFLILLIVIVRSIIYIAKNTHIWKEKYMLLAMSLLAIIITNGVSSIFISTIVYINSPATFISWISFGYYIRMIQLQEK